MDDIKYIIADNVRIFRKKENLTQNELAERADLSLDTIKRIESGKRTMSLDNFLRVAEALNVPAPYLLYGQVTMMSDVEKMLCILEGKTAKQKEYLLHMLQQMSEGIEKL